LGNQCRRIPVSCHIRDARPKLGGMCPVCTHVRLDVPRAGLMPFRASGNESLFQSASDRSILCAAQDSDRVQVSDVVDWFINLPWPKMASWLVVIALATQLKEFLGVCLWRIVAFVLDASLSCLLFAVGTLVNSQSDVSRMSLSCRSRWEPLLYHSSVIAL
jgi:hypothetical protein